MSLAKIIIVMWHKGRLLIVGGLPNKWSKLGYGGATVLMQNFIDYLDAKGIDYVFIQTNNYFKKDGSPDVVRNTLSFLFKFFLHLPSCKIVMLNFSDHATVKFLPFIMSLSKAFGKKVVFRKFGGSLDVYLSEKSKHIANRTFDAIMKSDLVLLETKSCISYVRQHTNDRLKIEWFPNSRMATTLRSSEKYQKRLVFISHILDSKGVGDILKVRETLPNDYLVTFYGPIKQKKYFCFDWEGHGVNYGGVLDTRQVMEVLCRSNLLLLPSYLEGYPGIIIEAMSVGVPCISTYSGGIPEIVTDGENGLLVDAGEVKQIKDAILSVDQRLYSYMREQALKHFEQNFNSVTVNNRIYETLKPLD